MQRIVYNTTAPRKQLGICYNQCMFDVADSVLHASIITYLKLDQIGFRPAVASLCHSIETCDAVLTTGAVNPEVQTRVCTVSCEDAAST
jgi:hypothetical protein